MPPGTVVAQVAHAAGNSSKRHPFGTYVVVLAAKNESHLIGISHLLSEYDITHSVVTESDKPYSGQAMAIGLELVRDRSKVKKCLSYLPLYGKSPYKNEVLR